MNEFDAYLSGQGPSVTPVQNSMQEFNKTMSGNATNEFTDYLNQESGLTPERRARLEAKSAKYKQDIAGLQQTAPDDNYIAAGLRGFSAGASDVADIATLGGYKKVRNKVLESFPDTQARVNKAEAEYHAPIEGDNPLARAAQKGVGAINTLTGYSLGLGGMIGKAAAGAVGGIGNAVVRLGTAGAMSGAATSGTESAIAGKDLGTIAKDAAIGGVGGGVVGSALGKIGKTIARAPERAIESEMAGLTEGIGQRTKIRKFLPKAEQIRAELMSDDGIRRAIKSDPVEALPTVKNRLGQIAETELNPFYDEMKKFGVDGVNGRRVINNLEEVKQQFTEHAEGAQRAFVDHLIDGFTKTAVRNGGRIPAEVLREEATAFQNQGFANLPQFPPIPLSKEAKQALGGALREAIADHIDTVYSSGDAAKHFRAANQRVSTWYAIKDLLEEKVARIKTDSPTMMGVLRGAGRLAHYPISTLLPYAGPAMDAADRGLLAPFARSGAGGSIAEPIGRTAPVMFGSGANALQEGAQGYMDEQEMRANMLKQYGEQ